MNLTIETALLTTILLVFMRISALLLMTPLFAIAPVPLRIRILIMLSFAIVLTAVLPPDKMVGLVTMVKPL